MALAIYAQCMVRIKEPSRRIGKRQKAQVVRIPKHKTPREAEEERMRRAYAIQPDTEINADDWCNAEEWKP
jgi:hypothetical protein